MKPEAQFEVESGQKLSAYDIFDANVVRTAWYQAVRAFFERYDYFLLPSGQVFPFDAETDWPKEIAGKTMDTYHRWMEVMIPVTMSSCPALAVPVGFSDARPADGPADRRRRTTASSPACTRPRLRRGHPLGDEAPAAAARRHMSYARRAPACARA